jgi:hypothetical protein
MRGKIPTPGKAVLLLAAWAAVLGTDAAAQPTPQQEPVQCWWRASAGAVRVAEPFTLLLTCSIAESDQQHVIIDQAKLAPEAISLSPFEVIGGGSLVESRSGGQWFFQRLYRVRILTDAVGEDVPLPPVVVTYQLETESSAGGRTGGIERRHELPTLPMRVVSLVPAGADDIREAAIDTFEDVDEALFGASVYSAAGLVLMGVGTIGLVVALATGFKGRQMKDSGPGFPEERLILRHVGRELEDIHERRTRERWTPDLVARALAAIRVVASYLSRRPPSMRPIEPQARVPDGGLIYSDKHGRRTLIVSSLTAAALGRAPGQTSDEVRDALATFTRAHYGRGDPADAGPLDAGMDAALAAIAAMNRQHALAARLRAAAARRLRAARIPWFR